jgi:hypothetical protein
MDPRLYQIATLATLLVYGMARLDFDVGPARVAFLVTIALVTQWLCTRWAHAGRFEPRSALISALSLGLLLRTDSWLLAAAAAALAVASKFAVRIRGKHVFNPTNVAIVVLILLTDRVWVSPGQWGSTAIFAFGIASAGFWVVQRAARADVTLAFLAFMAAIQFGRAAWLGQSLGSAAAPHGEWRPAPLRVLHDLGSQNDTRLASRPPRLRIPGGGGRRNRCPSVCIAPMGLCGRSQSARCWCRSSIACFLDLVMRGPERARAVNLRERATSCCNLGFGVSAPLRSNPARCFWFWLGSRSPRSSPRNRRWRSAASMSPAPMHSSSTRHPKSCWCATTTAP